MATSIRLAPEMEQRLDFLAAQTGRTKSYPLREIIAQGIEDMEDYYLAANVLKRVRKGQEPVYSAADVRKDLGLGDYAAQGDRKEKSMFQSTPVTGR
jgi:RHH-type rel operon transcriptional repressor/antitoxin RelB